MKSGKPVVLIETYYHQKPLEWSYTNGMDPVFISLSGN